MPGSIPVSDDLSALFAERHAYLAWSLSSLGQLPAGTARYAAFADLTSVLTAHLRSVVSALSSTRTENVKQLERFSTMYDAVGLVLADTLVTLRSPDKFADQFQALSGAVATMCRAEREFILPSFDTLLGSERRMEIARLMEEIFESHVGVVGVDGFPRSRARSTTSVAFEPRLSS